ncbi:hypothetical protein [Spirosoma areae]
MKFKITTGRKPASKLEAHLLHVAKAWSTGKTSQLLDTLDAVYNALQREKSLYCDQNKTARVTSIRIMRTNQDGMNTDSILIGSAEGSISATLTLMTAQEVDVMEIQDSLLIPVR